MADGTCVNEAAPTAICDAYAPNPEPRTLSPTTNPWTPAPTAETTPAKSLPGVNGGGILIWYVPCTNSASTKLTPAAAMSTTTCPSRGTRSSDSTTDNNDG